MVGLSWPNKWDKTKLATATAEILLNEGVLAVAISPDGTKAICAGMDDDHHISALDL